jgi:thiamine kinase-like enzyme
MRVDEVVERLWPGRVAEVEPLGGGLTNHNFKVTVDGDAFVLRLAGTDTALLGIDRRHEHASALRAAELGIGPEVVAFLEPDECLVTRFVGGAPLPDETIREPETIARVARALRALHGGPPVPGRFDPFRVVEAYRDTILARGGAEPDEYAEAQAVAERIEAALGQRPERHCHNDLLAANLIGEAEGRLWIVDWEYAGMGDPYFDLANFAVNNGLDEQGEQALLEAYGDADHARLTLMRYPSDFREAMWGAVQHAVSSLDVDFAAYAAEHFARMRATAASARFRDALERVKG